jgi:CRP-like cAMP-binding protein
MAIYGRRSEKADALADIPLFSSLSNKERQELARHVDELPVKSGAVLTKQGDPGDAFYLIVEGKADVIKNGTKIARLGPGDAVGEMALLDGEPRSATVMMTTDGTILTMPRREFKGVLHDIPGISSKMLVALSLRLREANSRLVE